MPFSEEQRDFYKRAKAAGWAPEKIRAGIDRIAERSAAAAIPSPEEAMATQPDAPSDRERFAERSALDQILLGGSANLHGLVAGAKQRLGIEGADEEAKRMRAIQDITGSTGWGTAGKIASGALASAPLGIATGGAGLPAVLATEGIQGLAMGAAEPTLEGENAAENAVQNAALNMLIPAGGAALRGLVGSVDDPAMRAAADVLKKADVKVPKADIMPGGISRAGKFTAEHLPGLSHIAAARASADNQKVADTLFKMLGTDTPVDKAGLKKITQEIGERIRSHSAGVDIPVPTLAGKIDDAVKAYDLPTSMMDKQSLKTASELTDLATPKYPGAVGRDPFYVPPTPTMRGDYYRNTRTALGAKAAKADPVTAKLQKSMIGALDDQLDAVLGKSGAAERIKDNQKYRVAKILRQSFKNDKFDIPKAYSKMQAAVDKGDVMPEAMELLKAADLAIPKVKPRVSKPAVIGGAALMDPTSISQVVGAGMIGSMLARPAMNTGIPQYLARNPVSRQATAAALRGINQEIADED